jgi:hypothetical protein
MKCRYLCLIAAEDAAGGFRFDPAGRAARAEAAKMLHVILQI